MGLYRISGPWKGALTIVSRPRGGDWLSDETRTWKNEGLDVVVSLLTREEQNEFGLLDEQGLSEKLGLQFVSLPIADLGVPSSREEGLRVLSQIEKLLTAGKNVGVHCRQSV